MSLFFRATSLTLTLTISLELISFGYGPNTLADPTDDFSFSFAQRSERDVYALMPVSQVDEILSDHLQGAKDIDTRILARHLLKLCRQHRFDPAFILSLIEAESQFQVNAKSQAGAVGLMQVMPATARGVVREFSFPKKFDLRDPFTNLTIGITYLAQLRDRYRDVSPYYLLAAYNLGPARLEALLKSGSFKPTQTLKYFYKIRREVPRLRYYQRTPKPNEA